MKKKTSSVFENKQGITKIEFCKDIKNYCPLGKDWYTSQLEVIVYPDKVLMDYCVVEKYIESLKNTELIIEDVVSKVYDYLYKYFKPKHLIVSVKATDAAHFPVCVTKETEV